MRGKLSIALGVLAALVWAVPVSGAAHHFSAAASSNLRPDFSSRIVKFRIDEDRGLLLTAWINGRGPFLFALDTGAGVNLVSQQLVNSAGLKTNAARQTLIGGLSGSTTTTSREANIQGLALGSPSVIIPGDRQAYVVPSLPSGVDGILDPAQAFAPFGYSIDIPQRSLLITETPQLSVGPHAEGATVAWLVMGDSDRPFVKLGDGRLALIDTGSRFGLAVNSRQAIVIGRNQRRIPIPTLDVGGGNITSRRVDPTTISIGELVLRRIPTDILSGVSDDAPLILGRDALSPFRITFDPQRRLIAFVAEERER